MQDETEEKKIITPDIHVSHGLINYLNAGYQGRFAYLNILSQLQYKTLNPEDMSSTRSALDRVNIWLNDLKKGVPLFRAHWNYAESFESQKAVQLMETLEDDLSHTAQDLYEVFQLQNLRSAQEEIKFLIAAYGRYAYARDNYIREFITFGETFDAPDIVREYKPFLADLEEDIQLVHALLSSLQNTPTLEQKFFDALLEAVLTLPGTFMTHVHDIRQLISPYKGGFTFETAGISEEESHVWAKLNITPVDAGYWRAHNFAPAEAVEWTYAGFDHTTAAKWKVWGFDAQQAAPWYEKQFPLPDALAWSGAGLDVEQSLAFIRQGYMDPAEVPEEKLPKKKKNYMNVVDEDE